MSWKCNVCTHVNQTSGNVCKCCAIYHHKVTNNATTCEYIKDDEKTNSALQCPIYKNMKQNHQFSEENLQHLHHFVHFKNEYEDKDICPNGQQCKAFERLQNGGHRLDDRCHIKLYNHPPRTDRVLRLSQNIHSFVFNDDDTQNHPVHKTTDDERKQYQKDGYDIYTVALITEVIKNGYKYDLCLLCDDAQSNCTHDVFKKNGHTLISIAEEKIKHPRNRNQLGISYMLALLLYTGCDCNYDLCASQRNGNYKKWKWFDERLFCAIDTLSAYETGHYKLYSGLNKVKLNKKSIDIGYFPTYTSTSWQKQVALDFMGNNEGMVIEFDTVCRSKISCCDVSWISKFQSECEILIARSVPQGHQTNKFSLTIMDDAKQMQTVKLDYKR